MSQDTIIVAVAGGTASGKSTLVRALQDSLGAEECVVICHDRYYLDVEDPSSFNYDHPDALDTDLLVQHLRALKSGDAVELPVYDYATHTRQPQTERVEPRRVVVVEGILVLENDELYSVADLRVYVHAPADLRLVRRIRRDSVERGRSLESVLNQWVNTVRSMHIEHVEPCRVEADLVLEGMGLIEPLVEQLNTAIANLGRKGIPDGEDAITLELSGFLSKP